VRTTIQALAAVLGGTQSLHTNSMDEALALPTESAARLALRTQQVIAHESGVVDTADPLGGSYAIEHLTDEVEEGALEYLRKIDTMGGMLRAIETGYVQREIQEAAYRYQKAVEAQEQVVVGVNRFQVEEEPAVNVLRIDPALEQAQVERIRALRERRDAAAVTAALAKLKQAATTDENLLPRILECVESYATVGEISNTLREIWGEYRETSTI
jgi:methylmalonyl-CoA mutase N-terminal domain/subunit